MTHPMPRTTSIRRSLDAADRPIPALLDEVHHALRDHEVRAPFGRLVDALAEAVEPLAPDEVRRGLQPVCAAHPVADLLRQDPFTHRSATKPRGYAGDAALIDYIYGLAGPGPATTVPGTEVFAQMMARRGPASVRHRRALIAAMIDAAAARADGPIEVMSLACGHLREAALSEAVASGRARITAFDQDRLSVDEARRSCSGLSVDVRYGSVRQAIAGRLTPDRYDLVYAAGLYDYLADATARRLTARLFDLLRPGGRLLIANFLPGNRERGYMEAFMDWYLTYRTADEVRACGADIPRAQVASDRIFLDPEGAIAYYEVMKGADAAGVRQRRGRGQTAHGPSATPAAPAEDGHADPDHRQR